MYLHDFILLKENTTNIYNTTNQFSILPTNIIWLYLFYNYIDLVKLSNEYLGKSFIVNYKKLILLNPFFKVYKTYLELIISIIELTFLINSKYKLY